jgi:hypothetical protein
MSFGVVGMVVVTDLEADAEELAPARSVRMSPSTARTRTLGAGSSRQQRE